MSIRFEVRYEAFDGLSQQTWRFVGIDDFVVLDAYREEERQTRRHAFKPIRVYQRILSDYTQNVQSRLTESEVPIPANLWEDARKELMSKIRFGLWSEFQKGKR